MKASDLFVKCLEEEGVEYVFAVPGEENLDLLESLRKSMIEVIVTRHEQGAAFMAATYGRLTGKVGVCMATLGPGATNLVTGIAYAQLGGMPILAITGQKAIREKWQANFQVIDVIEMMRPITKKTVRISGPKSIPMEIREAFKKTTTERLGAAHIELPEDIASENVDEIFQPLKAVKLRRPIADPKGIGIAADMIRNAKNPIIIISSRGQRNMVSKNLLEFIDTTNIYVILTQLGKGVLPADHKNCMYAFGIHKRDYVNSVVDSADLIITIGYSTVEHPPSIWNKNMDKKLLHIDFTPAETDVYYSPDFELVGDIACSISMLKDKLSDYCYDGRKMAQARELLTQKLHREGANDPAFPMKPRRIVSDVRKVMGRSDIVSLDNGIYKLWFSRHYPTYEIGTFLIDNTLATMGAGLSAAMGAKLVNPKKKVLAICGDGGFMMNSQELETAVRCKIPVVVLLLNDNAFGFIKWKQQNYGFKDFALDLGNPDFVKYAESYGAKGFRVEKADDLIPILNKAFATGLPAIVECAIDYSDNVKVWNKELGKL